MRESFRAFRRRTFGAILLGTLLLTILTIGLVFAFGFTSKGEDSSPADFSQTQSTEDAEDVLIVFR